MGTASTYRALGFAAGMGSLLGSGAIIALSATLSLWQQALGLDAMQVGMLSAALMFAFAVGSFCGGLVARRVGLTVTFNLTMIVCAAAFALCAGSLDFAMLLAGVTLSGLAAGVELPVSLSVMGRDIRDVAPRTKAIGNSQVLWSAGILGSYVLALAASPMHAVGARAVYAALAVIAALVGVWRLTDRRFAALHAVALSGDDRRGGAVAAGVADRTDGAGEMAAPGSLRAVLRGTDGFGRPYARTFALIALFYLMWNLMANSINQFQTYLLVVQHATQRQAVVVGIVASVLCVAGGMVYTRVTSKRGRQVMFWLGSAMQVVAMAVLAAGGTMAATVAAVLIFQFFCNFAGEMNAKVWTQKSFPGTVSTQAQSLILGLSRFPCAVASLLLPTFMAPGTIGALLWAFVAVAAASMLFGALFVAGDRRTR
ncbi:MFS transporter [Bifidobacterium avesanii]|nr:MFS transporter [Bifidobacterium avesanii]KAB8290611.1 sugar transporter [Bifidobacterium avesanii]